MPDTVGILGAGTMGAGIAQVAAVHGWHVELRDVDETLVVSAIDGVRARLARLVEKERLSADEGDAASARLRPAAASGAFASCSLLIEAVVEDLGVKTSAIGSVLADLPATAIIATNTSSLSVTALGKALGQERRTVGMHFFNPAPLLKLVEVIAGDGSDRAVVERAVEIGGQWGKRVARAADVPGFIVNHVARPYYLEAFRILEDGLATVTDVDGAMTGLGGFRMGPFALTDLIGQDVNAATTRSVWEQLDRPPLLAPSARQEALVANGDLGRKTGRGMYDYTGEDPMPAVTITPRRLEMPRPLRRAVERFTAAATRTDADLPDRYVFARILAALFVQAALAHERGVAEKADIDTALEFGTNYPHGPFTWAERIGPGVVTTLLNELNRQVSDDRFAVPDSLSAVRPA